MMYLMFAAVVLGSFFIGAWLVVQGHPWFGLLVIFLGSCASVTSLDGKEKP